MTDRLESLFNNFSVNARVFHSGRLCGINSLDEDEGCGQLHLVKKGRIEIHNQGQEKLLVTEPSLLLYPRPLARRFITDATEGAELVCANLYFEGGNTNPIREALPAFVCLPLSVIDGAEAILDVLFEEAFETRCGRQVLINKLFDVGLIQILRHLMESAQVNGGMLAGLSHSKLRKSLVAMHEHPEKNWSLNSLADTAGMSRSVFANTFRECVGSTPGNYLQSWRVHLTKKALRSGRPVKLIIFDVGYSSEAALIRAFKSQCGMTPKEWLKSDQSTHGANKRQI
ncbi:AraC family transcriptional regulator [Neptuniibacter sp. QD29_5]|uniref:AraC family transcriptional regulator n=1 Tax=Neptuniibacter sp. QD29_5 TaxID=3398207 RepID=UPI0039F57C48